MTSRVVLGASLLGISAACLIGAPAAQAADVNCPTADGAYAGGTGTAGDPFLISTPAQLQRLRDTSADWNDTVRLTSDINMGDCTWASTIGGGVPTWTGTFDGDGHVVWGLDIDLGASANGYAGFIAYLGSGGSIIDFGFTGNVSLTRSRPGGATAYVGGLVGFTGASTSVTNSFATGDVTVTVTATPGSMPPGQAVAAPMVGGLIGNLQDSLANSWSSGAVTVTASATASGSGSASARAYVGGLVGNVSNGAVVNSYSTSTSATSLTATGGSSQTTDRRVGGALGELAGSGPITGVVWDTTASGETSGVGFGPSSGVTGLTTTEMQQLSTYGPTGQNWSISEGYTQTTIWGMCPAYAPSYPFLNALASSSTCPPPPPPSPASPPRDAQAVAGDASAVVSWTAPASSGSFPISHYQVISSPGSDTCLVPAPTLSCDVTGLTNDTAYTFTVTALTGLGWSPWSEPSNAVVPRAQVRPSVVITGSRDGQRIVVTGTTEGFGMGGTLRPWVRMPGQTSYTQGTATIRVSIEGTFTWQRRAGKKTYVYVMTPDGLVRSNTVTIAAR